MYSMIVRRDHLPIIRDEGFYQFVPFFPLEVVLVEAFYIVGYSLGC